MDTTDTKPILFETHPRWRRSIYVAKLDKNLLQSLAIFFGEGIKQGDLCIAVLTRKHLKTLRKLLRAKNIDMQTATRTEQFLGVDAKSMLAMLDFDEAAYQKEIEDLSLRASWQNQPVRAFGEVVRLKWPRLGSRFGFYIPQNE